MKLRSSKRTSIIGAGRMVVARRRGDGAPGLQYNRARLYAGTSVVEVG